MPNPTGKGGFAPGQTGNPGGRSKRHIGDLSREARRYAKLAMDTLVKICKTGTERNKLVAAREILDRGYGRPVQMIDASVIQKKLSELSADELIIFGYDPKDAQEQLETARAAGKIGPATECWVFSWLPEVAADAASPS